MLCRITFKSAQNSVSVSDESQTDNESEFQSVEPETAKHLCLQTLVHQETHFVFNSLLNGQPMQSMSNVVGDVVELPLTQYDSSCGVYYVL